MDEEMCPLGANDASEWCLNRCYMVQYVQVVDVKDRLARIAVAKMWSRLIKDNKGLGEERFVKTMNCYLLLPDAVWSESIHMLYS